MGISTETPVPAVSAAVAGKGDRADEGGRNGGNEGYTGDGAHEM